MQRGLVRHTMESQTRIIGAIFDARRLRNIGYSDRSRWKVAACRYKRFASMISRHFFH